MPTVASDSNTAPVRSYSFALADAKVKPEFVLDAGAVTGNLYVYQVTGAGKTLIGVMPSRLPGFMRSSSMTLPAKLTHAGPNDTFYLYPGITAVCHGSSWTIYVDIEIDGAPTGGVEIITAKVVKGVFQLTQVGTLQQSTKNGGLGLAVDSAGNLYASNSRTNAIDVFTAAELQSGSGSPARTIHTRVLTQVYWLATAGKTLLANGLDRSGNYDITEVNVRSGADRLVNQLCKSETAGKCYPGGMEVGPKPSTLLYVNNETNDTIGAYTPPWTGAPTSSVTYPAADLVASISLDTTNNLLWGGNQDEADGFYCGTGSRFYYAADNLGFTVPLKSVQTNTPPYGRCVSGVPSWDVFEGTVTTSMFKT
jgi:hypothetical protein